MKFSFLLSSLCWWILDLVPVQTKTARKKLPLMVCIDVLKLINTVQMLDLLMIFLKCSFLSYHQSHFQNLLGWLGFQTFLICLQRKFLLLVMCMSRHCEHQRYASKTIFSASKSFHVLYAHLTLKCCASHWSCYCQLTISDGYIAFAELEELLRLCRGEYPCIPEPFQGLEGD